MTSRAGAKPLFPTGYRRHVRAKGIRRARKNLAIRMKSKAAA